MMQCVDDGYLYSAILPHLLLTLQMPVLLETPKPMPLVRTQERESVNRHDSATTAASRSVRSRG